MDRPERVVLTNMCMICNGTKVLVENRRISKGSTQKFVALGYLRSFPIKRSTKYEQRIRNK